MQVNSLMASSAIEKKNFLFFLSLSPLLCVCMLSREHLLVILLWNNDVEWWMHLDNPIEKRLSGMRIKIQNKYSAVPFAMHRIREWASWGVKIIEWKSFSTRNTAPSISFAVVDNLIFQLFALKEHFQIFVAINRVEHEENMLMMLHGIIFWF